MATLINWLNTYSTAILAISTVFLAIGTVVLAIVAIFQDWIRTKLKHPELDLTIENSPPDCHKTTLQFSNLTSTSFISNEGIEMPHFAEVYYFRCKVINSGNEKAEDVEVFASELSKRQADGTYKIVETFLPMNLVWSHIRLMFFPSISPKTYKHCDLAHIINPIQRRSVPNEDNKWPNVSPVSTVLSFDTIVKPFTLSYLVPFGTYQLKLVIAARNAKPINKTVEISLTGDWFEEEHKMLGEGIGLKVLN